MVCPLCGHDTYTVYLNLPHHRIVRCAGCGLVYVNPQPTDHELTLMYNKNYFASDKTRTASSVGYYDYMAEKPLLLSYFRRKITFLRTILLGKKVLEIGSSYGFFLEEAKRAHLDCIGIDISWEAVAYAKNQGLNARATDLFRAKFPSHSFDGVVGFHLIEHVSDPLAFLREIHRVIKPGGVILFSTPREGGYLQHLLGKHWRNYRHQEHLYFFSRETMTLLLKKAGFHHIRSVGDETRWYPIHFLFRGVMHVVGHPWSKGLCVWAEKVFRITPLSYLQFPLPLDIMIVTAKA